MTTQFVSTDISGPYIRVYLADGDGVWVSRNGLVGSTSDFGLRFNAIYGIDSNHMVHIEGAVSGYNGVQLGDDPSFDSGNSVMIASTGVVYGWNFGVLLFGQNARLNNFGLLNEGVYFFANGLGMSRIDNAGDIISTLRAVYHEGSETLSLSNTGTIRGTIAAFFSTGATTTDLIRNKGEMIGDILLDGGDDLYDGRGGFVDGIVYGDAGNDTFRSGSGIELFDGGAGIDTLDFRSTAGVRAISTAPGRTPERRRAMTTLASKLCWARRPAMTCWSAIAATISCAAMAAWIRCRAAVELTIWAAGPGLTGLQVGRGTIGLCFKR